MGGDHGHEWSNSFWDCCSPSGTCFEGFCCPCCLHGKTSSRLRDPALKNGKSMNGDCCIYLLTAYLGFHWVPLMFKRGELRERFGIQGSGCGDCASAYFCPCCSLMQHEKEVDDQSGRMQAPGGYQAPPGMAYHAQ
ncbi:PLAC8-domain-containing protein [Aspergillus campestris IBT 28561]|uniref:PLAC8-domain-containing protein n=1 Tax=Aspergillus campestris (strain IBT 28561) TaxID=1392248 RepID=A0A2I1DGJ6_ASPC2|nr:PLAC8-domain-containing protein [Aspergillus campestris IBT 28561]PKY08988.1 PLAC8-domain-containing protein [Aspergillus campestris IBT 28561]